MVNRIYTAPGASRTAELSRQCLEDSERWFGDGTTTRDVAFHSLALAGEVGELCNIVKKIARGSLDGGDANVHHDMAMELTDAYTYLLNLAGILGVDLEKSYEQKRAVNEKRFTAQRRARENGRLH